mmetsp:Transcript_5351/g.7939  ORF Transcript_5351/g.7939 Transcript_5351/m.7939 type:complete len:121 (+) Transcript_5351:638-1000(+)
MVSQNAIMSCAYLARECQGGVDADLEIFSLPLKLTFLIPCPNRKSKGSKRSSTKMMFMMMIMLILEMNFKNYDREQKMSMRSYVGMFRVNSIQHQLAPTWSIHRGMMQRFYSKYIINFLS